MPKQVELDRPLLLEWSFNRAGATRSNQLEPNTHHYAYIDIKVLLSLLCYLLRYIHFRYRLGQIIGVKRKGRANRPASM